VQATAPASLENIPGEHGVHDVAPAALENVPGRQRRHGSMPVGLKLPGWHDCAEADGTTSTPARIASRSHFIGTPPSADLCRPVEGCQSKRHVDWPRSPRRGTGPAAKRAPSDGADGLLERADDPDGKPTRAARGSLNVTSTVLADAEG
jgi:hypothetical protein